MSLGHNEAAMEITKHSAHSLWRVIEVETNSQPRQIRKFQPEQGKEGQGRSRRGTV